LKLIRDFTGPITTEYIYGLLYDGKNALGHFEKAVRAAMANPGDAELLNKHLTENPGNLVAIRGYRQFTDLQKELQEGFKK